LEHDSRPDWQAVDTPKSSSVAEDWQGFHLHTLGFETNPEPFLEVLGSQTSEPSPLGSEFLHRMLRLAKCPAKLKICY